MYIYMSHTHAALHPCRPRPRCPSSVPAQTTPTSLTLVLCPHFRYTVDPYKNSTLPTSELNAAFLGGESAMWSPYFDSANFLTQAFPRAAAVAERLWSAQNVTDVYDAGVRLHAWRCRLLRRGLATAPVTGGLAIGSFGTAPPHIPHSGGHCADGPWEPTYTPPWEG